MSQIKIFLTLVLLLCASLVGCLSGEEDAQDLNLQVDYASLTGTIVDSYSDGVLVSSDTVTIEFDFSETTSDEELSIFGIDANDSRSPVEVNAQDTTIVEIEFTTHGIYEINLYAIDDDDNQENLSLTIRIELKIEWTEFDTKNPKKLTFDPTPSNGGEHPSMIEIDSTVENPNKIQELGGGQSVQITWNILDENDDTCQKNSDQVANGEQVTWGTIHFNTYLVHELIIEYDDGQDDININQSISILYNSD